MKRTRESRVQGTLPTTRGTWLSLNGRFPSTPCPYATTFSSHVSFSLASSPVFSLSVLLSTARAAHIEHVHKHRYYVSVPLLSAVFQGVATTAFVFRCSLGTMEDRDWVSDWGTPWDRQRQRIPREEPPMFFRCVLVPLFEAYFDLRHSAACY